jgi:hypothetical protein
MPFVVAIVLGLALVTVLLSRAEPFEQSYIWAAFVSHVLGTVALLWLHETRGGDMDGYGPGGMVIADFVRQDLFGRFPELLKSIVGMDTPISVRSDTTGAMFSLAAFVYLLVGNSLYAACFFTGCLAMLGQVLLYRVMREGLVEAERRIVAVGCLLVPSANFWTSGLIKEAFCVAGLGTLVYGAFTMTAKRRWSGFLYAAIGGVVVAGVKPYVLFPLVIATAAWMFARRGREVRLGYVLAALLVGVGGVVVLGTLFPNFGVQRLGEQISAQQYYSQYSAGGSYTGGTGDTDMALFNARDTSLLGQVRFLPIALVNAMFRPFLFEAGSPPLLAAAIETSILAVIFLSLVRRVKLRDLLADIVGSPVLLASAVFALTFGAAVGLASQNLGTLSRYRVPMMPALVTPMLLLWHRFRSVSRARPEPRPRQKVLPGRGTARNVERPPRRSS